MTITQLKAAGFDVTTVNHAAAVLSKDFPTPLKELCHVLQNFYIREEELIRGGGGEAPHTQRLRQALTGKNWLKREIVVRKIVDDIERTATTHTIDHVRDDEDGSVALEIEWNNKDPFFDRDLENFQRLHHDGAISVGIVITRGRSLQDSLTQIVLNFVHRHSISSFDDLEAFGASDPTRRQRDLVDQSDESFADAWTRMFVGDKFGSATTHWNKLEARIQRGVGNPCPLLLIGIPDQSVIP